MFSVHPEPFTLVARKEANIKQFTDLKGKRFNVGNPGSGTRSAMEELLAALEHEDVRLRARLGAQGRRARRRRCATTRSTASTTASAIRRRTSRTRRRPAAPSSCRSTGPAIDALVAKYPYYAKATIPGGMYANNPQPTPTYGVLATMVTSSQGAGRHRLHRSPRRCSTTSTSSRSCTRRSPTSTAKNMVKDGLSAPLHEGAAALLQEKGWMK